MMPPKLKRKREAWSWAVSAVLLATELTWFALNWHGFDSPVGEGLVALAISAAFAAIVVAVRGATVSGAFAGFVVAFGFALGRPTDLASLVALFVLTWAATAIHSFKKRSARPQPRDGIQVLANIGLAPVLYLWGPGPWFAAIAVLAEAAADTVASEIGQAFGGMPRLITGMRRVATGTNGGVSLVGTAAGIATALVVALAVELRIPFAALLWSVVAVTVGSAIIGMFIDSVLGATLEPRFLNNDGVNFVSVLVTGGIATILLRWFVQWPL